jgi:hypothetical protein
MSVLDACSFPRSSDGSDSDGLCDVAMVCSSSFDSLFYCPNTFVFNRLV